IYSTLTILEVSGLARNGMPEQVLATSSGPGLTADSETLTAASPGSFRLVAVRRHNDNDITPSTGWTEINDIDNTRTSQFRTALFWSTTEDQYTFTGANSTSSGTVILSIPKTNLTIPMKQLVVLATDDDGQNWEPAPGGISTGELGNIRATRAADEQLY